MKTGTCKLCQKEAELQESHIIPKFVYRWATESSGTGFLRNSSEPNKRVQDGFKRNLLCYSCEQLFSGFESDFSKKLFYPYLSASKKIIRYEKWLLNFCVSLSWRVLSFHLEEDNSHLESWSNIEKEKILLAYEVWKDFLLGKISNPSIHQQYILPTDQIVEFSNKHYNFSNNINRYFMRAIDMDVCRNSDTIFTYSKIGRFIIIGFIYLKDSKYWKGGNILSTGYIEPKKYVLPEDFLDYINTKAKDGAEAFQSISSKQKLNIKSSFNKNLDKFIESDQFNAMQADISMFGKKAFNNN